MDPGNTDPGDGGGGGTPGPGPTSTPTPTPTPTATPPVDASTCVSADPNKHCIGLKLVSYKDSAGTPTISEPDAHVLMEQVNSIWSTCDIAFQMEEYKAVDPTTVGLAYGSASEGQLTSIRNKFGNGSQFLVVITGPWSGSTIAWTVLPGGGPYGAIVDQQYGHNPYTVGHEIGHYMGLYHLKNSSNLMNPYIGTNTSGLSSSQCQVARENNEYYWQQMRRF